MTLAAIASIFAACASAQERPLLIVTPKRFQAAAVEYASFKKAQRPVEVAVLEEVLAATDGADDPERVKRFLFAAWKSRGIGFVLLVGDADVIPVRYMVLDRAVKEAFDYAFYPSDLYYADIAGPDGSFEDWNGFKEGFHAAYFGEVRGEKNKSDPINFDHIDYKPELAVGRWPVSTEAQLRIVMAKSRTYETGIRDAGTRARGDAETKPETKNDSTTASLLASPLPASPRPISTLAIMTPGWIDARPQLDHIISTLPKDWATERLYYTDGNKDFATPPPDEEHVVAQLNRGPRLVLHAGHGADDRWEGCFSVKSLAKVKNATNLPVVLSAGCSTARFATLPPYEPYVDIYGRPHIGTNAGEVFDAPPPPPSCYATGPYNLTGLGEQLLCAGPDGAAAYIGCNTGSQPCGVTLLEGFAGAVSKRATIGECWMDAVSYYYDQQHLATIKPTPDWYPASIFFQGMKFMFFGDPSLPVAK